MQVRLISCMCAASTCHHGNVPDLLSIMMNRWGYNTVEELEGVVDAYANAGSAYTLLLQLRVMG